MSFSKPEPKQKKCANNDCPETFRQFNSLQKTCSPKCEREYQENKKKKKENKLPKLVSGREITKVKPTPKLIQEAQEAINAYVRVRDYYLPCISCGDWAPHTWFFEAGHYRSVGSAPHLRFNLHNINNQCTDCNQRLSGNSTLYSIGLITKIGLFKVVKLEKNNEYRKYTAEYCERVKKVFRKKARRLKARERKKLAC